MNKPVTDEEAARWSETARKAWEIHEGCDEMGCFQRELSLATSRLLAEREWLLAEYRRRQG